MWVVVSIKNWETEDIYGGGKAVLNSLGPSWGKMDGPAGWQQEDNSK